MSDKKDEDKLWAGLQDELESKWSEKYWNEKASLFSSSLPLSSIFSIFSQISSPNILSFFRRIKEGKNRWFF